MAEPAVKKYRGEGASEISTVEATLIENSRAPFESNQWQSLFQICAIKVLKLGEKKSTQIYGTITLHHKWGKWKLYNGEKENAPTTTIPGDMEVTHPIFGIMSLDPLLITFELEGEFEDANEVTLTWMPFDDPPDEIATYTLRGEACTMQVRFIAFEWAVLADVEIYLLNLDNTYFGDEQRIYGSIYASFTKMHSAVPFLMFDKKEANSLLVRTGELVPLLRPLIAVPDENDLQIHVHLNTLSGYPIAGGTIKICPERGTWEGVLGKEHDEIRVVAKVRFSHFVEHKPTTKVREDWP